MLFKDKQGVFPQILAVTTNGTSGNQTFGISSGTLGCDPEGQIVYSAAVQRFMGERIDKVASDMSQGGGENLEALSNLIGIAPEDRAAFFELTKVNFAVIFPTEEATAEQALLSLQALMAEDNRLSRYVS
ncbi:MAG: DUF3015 domain-containing protein [bacterium]|nr:DUF3015 domain-containing protein [bacterium]